MTALRRNRGPSPASNGGVGRLYPCDASSGFGSRAPQAVLQRKAANLLGSSVSGAASPRGWRVTRQRGRSVVQLRQKGNGGLTRPWVITITRKRGREAGGVVKSKDDIPAKLAADF